MSALLEVIDLSQPVSKKMSVVVGTGSPDLEEDGKAICEIEFWVEWIVMCRYEGYKIAKRRELQPELDWRSFLSLQVNSSRYRTESNLQSVVSSPSFQLTD
jgi:hypothetical protein